LSLPPRSTVDTVREDIAAVNAIVDEHPAAATSVSRV
jgi:hypothetical protein